MVPLLFGNVAAHRLAIRSANFFLIPPAPAETGFYLFIPSPGVRKNAHPWLISGRSCGAQEE